MTKRIRRRSLCDGDVVVHTRHVVNFRDPNGKRRQLFFATKQEATEYRDDLVSRARKGDWAFTAPHLTLSVVLDHWLAEAKHHVKRNTWKNYQRVHPYIIGPLVDGSSRERRNHTMGRQGQTSAPPLALLGDLHLYDLSTARVRQWHNTLVDRVGRRTAQEMKRCLGAALKLAAEDFGITIPSMPAHIHRAGDRTTKSVLNPTQVRQLLCSAEADAERGIYYAFPFLTGVRPSEQLGLLWDAVDLASDSIEICRIQELDGSICDVTKTSSSTRRVPIPEMLKSMLLDWKRRCPQDNLGLGRVFPTVGRTYDTGNVGRRGLPLTYYNFRANYWTPALRACGLPYVTPHSARHTYISTLQAAGVEVGLVAKLVGHANANVTLSHYTHAMRGGDIAVRKLQEMYVTP